MRLNDLVASSQRQTVGRRPRAGTGVAGIGPRRSDYNPAILVRPGCGLIGPKYPGPTTTLEDEIREAAKSEVNTARADSLDLAVFTSLSY